MKRLIMLLALSFLFAVIAGAANQVDIRYGGIGYIQDTMYTNYQNVELQVWIENDDILGGMSLGFQVWSPDGATWEWTDVGEYGDLTGCVTTVLSSRLGDGSVFDMTGLLVTEQNIDETGRDTIMCGGVALMSGLPPGPLQHMYSYHFMAGGVAEGEVATLCFDSCFVPPSGAFVFVDAYGVAFPPTTLWPANGLCAPVRPIPQFCPVWDAGLPTSIDVDHCLPGSVTLSASDPEADHITFSLAGMTGGGGTAQVIDHGDGTCDVVYTPVPTDVGAAISIEIDATDPYHLAGFCSSYTLAVNVTNNPPTLSCGTFYNATCTSGAPIFKDDIVGLDEDACDGLQYLMISGPGNIDPETGEYTWQTTVVDAGNHEICVGVTDGYVDAICCFEVDVLLCEWYEVKIEKVHDVLQGHYVDVELSQTKGSDVMGGFDFLIGYDASALAFTEATLGEHWVDCGWEHFTYRYNWNGNCGAACPTGLVRLIGLAETVNGPIHPDYECLSDYHGNPIATLTFYVSNDRTFNCMYLPIQFYWMDCNDNSISVPSGDTLAVNNRIFTFEGQEIQDFEYGLPGYYGIPDDPCMAGDKVDPIRYVDFINGGIDVVCRDSIDARGDLNANGVPNEIADAVMFTNYFISGLGAFGGHIESSIAASDINNDGITLSVADLVYLIRVIVGDAPAYPKPLPESPVTFTDRAGVLNYDSPIDLGAVLLIFKVGDDHAAPQMAPGVAGMDMKFGYTGDELRVLIYNIGNARIIAGENALLTVPGQAELTGVEAASYDGFGVETFVRNLPHEFSVGNYPNPFNPSTTISLALPEASNWSVRIFNIAGQLVKEYAGEAEAGTVEVRWDGADSRGEAVASGIYFYKVDAGQYSATKKMVLMK